MTNQFFYTRKEQAQGSEEMVEFIDSININKVIRSVMMDKDTMVVLLDDIHERVQEKPNINVKTNKVIGVKRTRDIFQTEVYLTGDDITRFRKLTNIEA